MSQFSRTSQFTRTAAALVLASAALPALAGTPGSFYCTATSAEKGMAIVTPLFPADRERKAEIVKAISARFEDYLPGWYQHFDCDWHASAEQAETARQAARRRFEGQEFAIVDSTWTWKPAKAD